jgi:carbonic anhydrase
VLASKELAMNPARPASQLEPGALGAEVLPARGRLAILACMDASVDAAKLRGLPGSQAHVLRNAGARATDDAIHSLVLAHRLLGARELFVVQHEACGMARLSDEITATLWARTSADAGRHTLADRRGMHARAPIGRMTLASPAELVRAEVSRVRRHPDVPAGLPVRGFVLRADGRFYEIC